MPPLVPSLPAGPHFGVLGRFAGPRELYRACEQVRDAGYVRWDAHSPFPVHGLEKAMGLRPSKLPWLVLGAGLTGAGGAMLLQWWVHTQAYPLVISGKPFFSWPAFVPVTFEVGVLFAALAAVFGMLGMNQLPMFFHPLFRSKPFERFSDDAFFISIEAWDPKFDPQRTAEFLRRIGADEVELIGSGEEAA
jgi:hypothetical protein